MLTPPLGSNTDFFEFKNILTAEDPLGQTSEKGYLVSRHICIENGHIKCFFYFLGGCLRVIFIIKTFLKDRDPPPLGFKNSQIEIGKFSAGFRLQFFFRIKIVTPPLKMLIIT